jgi:hypothetical protein
MDNDAKVSRQSAVLLAIALSAACLVTALFVFLNTSEEHRPEIEKQRRVAVLVVTIPYVLCGVVLLADRSFGAGFTLILAAFLFLASVTVALFAFLFASHFPEDAGPFIGACVCALAHAGLLASIRHLSRKLLGFSQNRFEWGLAVGATPIVVTLLLQGRR